MAYRPFISLCAALFFASISTALTFPSITKAATIQSPSWETPVPNFPNAAPIPARTNQACSITPNGASCYDSVVQWMDQANIAEGGQAIVLPPGFSHMSGAVQLFVLTNLERLAFGLHPIMGMTSVVNAAALAGADASRDPAIDYTHPYPTGNQIYTYNSNYMYGLSASVGVYQWLFDDGPGGFNVDCVPGNMTGCWGHRDNILATLTDVFTHYHATPPSHYLSLMGGAVIPHPDNLVAATTIDVWISPQPTTPPMTITWNQISAAYPSGESPVGSLPAATVGSLWRQTGTTPVYIVTSSHTFYHIPSVLAFHDLGLSWNAMNMAPNLPALSFSTAMPVPTGTFWRQTGTAAVYIVTPANTLYHIPNPAIFYAFHGRWNQVRVVSHLPALPISPTFSY